jgi:hypothetical protein
MLRANSFESSWLMEVGAPIVVGALGVALLLAWIMMGVSVAAADSVADSHGVPLNRVLKGDRMPLAPSYPARQIDIPEVDSKLANGCEPVVSFLADRHLVHIAGRCVS